MNLYAEAADAFDAASTTAAPHLTELAAATVTAGVAALRVERPTVAGRCRAPEGTSPGAEPVIRGVAIDLSGMSELHDNAESTAGWGRRRH